MQEGRPEIEPGKCESYKMLVQPYFFSNIRVPTKWIIGIRLDTHMVIPFDMN